MLRVRLRPLELEAIQRRAARVGLSVSELVRRLLALELPERPEQEPAPPETE